MPDQTDPAALPRIDVSLVRQLIAEQFPEWAELTIRPVESDGWDNRTFHLGEEMSVRLPSAECYAAQVEKEQRWLPQLASRLPLPVPNPLAMGIPGAGYPWNWSIYQWFDGENARPDRIEDLVEFAVSLAEFLAALQRIDAGNGPAPGAHNFFRGGPLSTYDHQTRAAIAALESSIDSAAATRLWEAALDTRWHGAPVWLHGDVSAGNLLVAGGRLGAVIDFGCSAVGDPACDLTIAWTFFEGCSRDAFQAALPLDAATWARARGWALWKALITLAGSGGSDPTKIAGAQQVVADLLLGPSTRA